MRHVLTTGPGRSLCQVEDQPANVEPGRVVCLRPGRAANRPILRIMQNESNGKVPYRYNQFTLRVIVVISEA